jgi:hypothetical protein
VKILIVDDEDVLEAVIKEVALSACFRWRGGERGGGQQWGFNRNTGWGSVGGSVGNSVMEGQGSAGAEGTVGLGRI